jgi:hypothetical protein
MRQKKRRQRTAQGRVNHQRKPRKKQKASSKLHIPDRYSHQTEKNKQRETKKDSNHKINDNF